jgi:hypothetical protein
VAFSASVPGLDVVETIPWRSIWPPRERPMYILKRNAPSPASRHARDAPQAPLLLEFPCRPDDDSSGEQASILSPGNDCVAKTIVATIKH